MYGHNVYLTISKEILFACLGVYVKLKTKQYWWGLKILVKDPVKLFLRNQKDRWMYFYFQLIHEIPHDCPTTVMSM